MKKINYKFSINEPQPVIPPARSFQSILVKAKASIPWYAKTQVWGTAVVVVTTSVTAWLYSSREVASGQQAGLVLAKPLVANSILPDSNIQAENTVQLSYKKPKIEALSIPKIPDLVNEKMEVVHENNHIQESEILEPIEVENIVPKMAILAALFPDKFDTLHISSAAIPGLFSLKNGHTLEIPSGSVQHIEGSAVKGSFLFIYREINSPAEMLASGIIPRVESQYLENHGFIQLWFEQQGKRLAINTKRPVLMNFRILNTESGFGGFYAAHEGANFQQLFLGNVDENHMDEDMRVISERMMVKRSFRSWFHDLLHGTKSQWDTFERIDCYGNCPPLRKGTRSFEIRKAGIYGCAGTITSEMPKTHVRLRPASNETLTGTLYKINFDKNSIEAAPIHENEAEITITPGEKSALFVMIENSPYASVLDVHSYRAQILNSNSPLKEAWMRTYPNRLLYLDDLRILLAELHQPRAKL